MKTTLIIMAAGIGSRFGGGIKQLEPVGMHGEVIMDYSIHDAIEAGFNKIIFIIRKDIEEDFKNVIAVRIEKACASLGIEFGYAFQGMKEVPDGIIIPEKRRKPWGTGQAVLAAKNLIQEPFAVINADDYYGKEAFKKVHKFLISYTPTQPTNLCMVGFTLKNTLSDNGGVTRGICEVDVNGYLTDIVETRDIIKTIDDKTGAVGAAVDGKMIDAGSCVSMNMWGLTPEFLSILEKGFVEFFHVNQPYNPLEAEYLLPEYIGQLVREKKVSVQVLKTADRWFGLTYKEDKALVVKHFKNMVDKGIY